MNSYVGHQGYNYVGLPRVVHAAHHGLEAVVRPPHHQPQARCAPRRGARRDRGWAPRRAA